MDEITPVWCFLIDLVEGFHRCLEALGFFPHFHLM